MRTVYADVVFFVNFFVDYILLYLCFSFLHIKIKPLRLLCASVVGAVSAVVFVILDMGYFAKIPFSLVCLILMMFLCVGKRKVKTYVRAIISMYVFSVILGGIMIMVEENFQERKQTVILLVCICLMYILFKILGNFFVQTAMARYADVEIFIDKQEYRMRLLCDSGNLLVDPYTSLPIIILKCDMSEQCTAAYNLTRFVPVETVAGKDMISVITPKRINVISGNRKTEINAVVGFSEFSFDKCECFDGIMPLSLLENI